MVEFTVKPSGSGIFFEGRFLTTVIDSGYLLILEWTVVVCVFQETSSFHVNCHILDIKLFIVLPFFSFHICRICGDVVPLIPDIGCLFQISLSRGLSLLLLKEPACGFIDFLSFTVLISLISALIVIVYFFVLLV